MIDNNENPELLKEMKKMEHPYFKKLATEIGREEDDFEFIEKAIPAILLSQHKTNEGNNGIIYKVEMEAGEVDENSQNFTEKKELAIKILKVGNFDDLQTEYRNQIKAYEIVTEKINQELEEGKEVDLAALPTPYYCNSLEASESISNRLNKEGVEASSGKVGYLLMEWIPGEDVATLLFKEALRRKQSLHLERIKQSDFNQLHGAISQEFEFSRPGGKAVREGDRIFEQRKVEYENENKIYKFLKKDGYKFPSSTVAKIKNTIALLKEQGLELWDSHARNVLVNSDGRNPYLIDFAPQKDIIGTEAKGLDSFELVRKLENLSLSEQEEREKNIQEKTLLFLADNDRLVKNERWSSKFLHNFSTHEAFEKEAGYQIIKGLQDTATDFLHAVISKYNSGEMSAEKINKILDSGNLASTEHWRKEAIEMVKRLINKDRAKE